MTAIARRVRRRRRSGGFAEPQNAARDFQRGGRMKRAITALMMFFMCLGVHSQDFNPYEGRIPLFAVIQTDPWAMVIGSDTPLACLYTDGTLIYYSKTDSSSFPPTTKNWIHRSGPFIPI
ncbi:MAG: hypothetical protein JXD23_13450 [Spirochaetales bacterium]|nr:hypothetical protein [Spirochaetales bacterium]